MADATIVGAALVPGMPHVLADAPAPSWKALGAAMREAGQTREPVMATGPDARLAELGLTLPQLRPRAGNYVGWCRVGDLLFLAGQGADGWVGRVGDRFDLARHVRLRATAG
jgi:hypothetical protein